MAKFEDAFEVVMRHEDFLDRNGKFTGVITGKAPNRTRFGVDEGAHPELSKGPFYTTMPLVSALDVARTVFLSYWTFNAVTSQKVATKLLDACVNAGRGNAIPAFARALAAVDHEPIVQQWGATMIALTNSCDEQELVDSFCTSMVTYYKRTAAKKGYAAVPGGWKTRAVWGASDAWTEAFEKEGGWN